MHADAILCHTITSLQARRTVLGLKNSWLMLPSSASMPGGLSCARISRTHASRCAASLSGSCRQQQLLNTACYISKNRQTNRAHVRHYLLLTALLEHVLQDRRRRHHRLPSLFRPAMSALHCKAVRVLVRYIIVCVPHWPNLGRPSALLEGHEDLPRPSASIKTLEAAGQLYNERSASAAAGHG